MVQRRRIRRAHGRKHAIADRKRFGRAVGQLIAERFAGNRTRAAERLGIHRVHLYKLEYGELAAVTEGTMERLRSGARPELQHEFNRAVVSARAKVLLTRYLRWLDRELLAERGAAAPYPNGISRAALELFLHPEHFLGPRLLARWKAAAARHHEEYGQPRLLLAAQRAWGALGRLEAPGPEPGVERRYRELTEHEQRRYLEAGVLRELILLDRPGAAERAERVARGSSRRPEDAHGL